MGDRGITTMKLVLAFIINHKTKQETGHSAMRFQSQPSWEILHRSSRERLHLEPALQLCLFLRSSQEAGRQEPSLCIWKGEGAASSGEENGTREKWSEEAREGGADVQRRKWIYSIESLPKSAFGYLLSARLPLFYMHGKNSDAEIISSKYKTYG